MAATSAVLWSWTSKLEFSGGGGVVGGAEGGSSPSPPPHAPVPPNPKRILSESAGRGGKKPRSLLQAGAQPSTSLVLLLPPRGVDV